MPFPFTENLSDLGIKPAPSVSPALAAGFFTTDPSLEADIYIHTHIYTIYNVYFVYKIYIYKYTVYILFILFHIYIYQYLYVCLSIYLMYYLYIFKNIIYVYGYIDKDTYLSWRQTYLQNIIYVIDTYMCTQTYIYIYTHICLLWQVSLLIISFHIYMCVSCGNKIYNQSSTTLLEGNKLFLPLSLNTM